MAIPEHDFDFEFTTELDIDVSKLREKALNRLLKLKKGHNDIIGASIDLYREEHEHTPHVYEARIVVYMKPNNIAVIERGPEPDDAINKALKVVERRVRNYREKLYAQYKRKARRMPGSRR